jgi:hypothetical protein
VARADDANSVANFGHTTDAANFLLADIECPPELRAFIDALIGVAGGRADFFTAGDELLAARLGRSTKSVQRHRDELARWQKTNNMTLAEIEDEFTDGDGKRHAHRYRVHLGRIAVETCNDARASEKWRANPGIALAEAARKKRNDLPELMPRKRRGSKRRPDAETQINAKLRTARTLIEKAAAMIGGIHLQQAMHGSRTPFEPDPEVIDAIRRSVEALTGESHTASPPVSTIKVGQKMDTRGALPDVEPSPSAAACGQNVRKETEHSAAAVRALEAFESVGASVFQAVLKDDRTGDVAEVTHDASSLRKHLGDYLARNAAGRESLIIRPRGAPLIQVDDLDAATLARLQPFAFLTIETSPGSYQAWIALHSGDAPALADVRSRLLAGLAGTGNGGSYGALRFPGSLNCKPNRLRADGTAPRVRLMAASARRVTAKELEAAHLLAPPPSPAPKPSRPRASHARRPLPSYAECLSRKNGDRSRADASFLKIAELRGWPLDEACDELERVSGRAQEEKARGRKDYVRRTARFVAGTP